MTECSSINRIAVTLIPTQACVDWINSHDDDKMTLDEIRKDPTVFLLPQGRGDPESQVRRRFRAMFADELNSWYTDETMWPKNLSFTTFKKFFTIHVSSTVLDLGTGEIIKDEG